MNKKTKEKLQDLFDRSCGGLIKQGKRSINPDGNCVYLDEKTGCKCAVGVLIPTEKYSKIFDEAMPKIDTEPYYSGASEKYVAGVGAKVRSAIDVRYGSESVAMLGWLQMIHDTANNIDKRWADKCKGIAELFRLNTDVFKGIEFED